MTDKVTSETYQSPKQWRQFMFERALGKFHAEHKNAMQPSHDLSNVRLHNDGEVTVHLRNVNGLLAKYRWDARKQDMVKEQKSRQQMTADERLHHDLQCLANSYDLAGWVFVACDYHGKRPEGEDHEVHAFSGVHYWIHNNTFQPRLDEMARGFSQTFREELHDELEELKALNSADAELLEGSNYRTEESKDAGLEASNART